VHFPCELTPAVDHPVTWDIRAVLRGIQCPAYQAGSRANPESSGNVPVRCNFAPWNLSNQLVDALVEIPMLFHFHPRLPQRIVCLTEETTETLYALGAGDLVVGVSGFTVRPPEARRKPKVSTFLDANIEAILALRPDMVLAWSDLQAPICAELIRHGVEVVCFNQRSIEGILSMILRLGALVGKASEARRYVRHLRARLRRAAERGARRRRRPRVYFEEWYDPLIAGIRWVSEIIRLCGGDDVFEELSQYPDAKRRIIADPDEVVRRRPDIILASWCGKMFKPERVRKRPGWEAIPAVRTNHLYEIPASVILQPGPAALTEGVDHILGIFDRWEHECSA